MQSIIGLGGKLMIKCNLQDLIWERRTRLSELARSSGVSYKTIHSLYHGKTTRIDFATINALCSALKYTHGDLFTYTADDSLGGIELTSRTSQYSVQSAVGI